MLGHFSQAIINLVMSTVRTPLRLHHNIRTPLEPRPRYGLQLMARTPHAELVSRLLPLTHGPTYRVSPELSLLCGLPLVEHSPPRHADPNATQIP